MTIIKTASLFFSVCIAIAGCNQGTQPQLPVPPPSPPPQTTQQMSDLAEQVRKLRMDMLRLQFRVDALESGDALVSAEEQGYSIAKTNFGTFTISAKSLTPYLDGFKIKLCIGNLTSANFNGAKFTVSWGPPFDENNPAEYSKNQKKKEFNVTNKFLSGAFSDLDIILTPAKPEEVKTFTVSIQLDQISLRVR